MAYGQFCRHFLAPLALMSRGDVRLILQLLLNFSKILLGQDDEFLAPEFNGLHGHRFTGPFGQEPFYANAVKSLCARKRRSFAEDRSGWQPLVVFRRGSSQMPFEKLHRFLLRICTRFAGKVVAVAEDALDL